VEDAGLALCVWSRRYTPPIVYTESDFIRVYFEAADPATYRRAIPEPFTMPPRPLVRVSVLDFYGMENGPLYRESEISVLALHEGRPGWVVLTMPVTDGDACAGGRNALGTPTRGSRHACCSGSAPGNRSRRTGHSFATATRSRRADGVFRIITDVVRNCVGFDRQWPGVARYDPIRTRLRTELRRVGAGV